MRTATVHKMVSPTPEADTELAVKLLEDLTVGDAKLRQRKIGKWVFVLITGRPWIVLPRLSVNRKGFHAGFLLWMLTTQKKDS